MKQTENISIGGFSFTIESDAYQELSDYIHDIRDSFKDDASADEIVEDIEVRIAELLTEKCQMGNVVNLQMVWEIKSRIGNPKELAQEDTEAEGPAENPAQGQGRKSAPKEKRIYRDVQHRVIGGVCSGFGAYFGVDKVFIRILFIVFFFATLIGSDNEPLFFIILLIYVCLWIAMPAARTVEEKCQMTGKPINLEGFRSNKENEFSREVKEVATSPAGRTIERVGKIFLGLLFLMCGLGGLLACIFIPAMPKLMDYLLPDCWAPAPELDPLLNEMLYGTTFWGLVLIMSGLLFVWFLYYGVMLTFGLKAPSWKPGLVLFIAWLISIFAICGYVIKCIADTLPMMI